MTADHDAARVFELEQDNQRLRRLLDQRDAPGELRHRLRNTLALLRAIVRRSADTERDLVGYVAHLEDRLDAIGRAQAMAEQQGEVGLQQIITDELFHYKVTQSTLSGPDVRLQPGAGLTVALALHELAVNAVEHGGLGDDAGRVEVTWAVTDGPEPRLTLEWVEFGVPDGAVSARRGFGTDVLSRLLPYELKAETDLTFPPGECRCSIGFPLPARVGRVAARLLEA